MKSIIYLIHHYQDNQEEGQRTVDNYLFPNHLLLKFWQEIIYNFDHYYIFKVQMYMENHQENFEQEAMF